MANRKKEYLYLYVIEKVMPHRTVENATISAKNTTKYRHNKFVKDCKFTIECAMIKITM